MRVRIVVNPVASSVTPRRIRRLRDDLTTARTVTTVDVVATLIRGHATDLARTAVDDGVDVVVVAGGDGTLDEAANGLVGTATALAPFPGGSTNVFARAVGYGNRPDVAGARIAAALDAAHVRRIGVGVAGERRFLFHAGFGFDAAVVAAMERHGRSQRVKRFAAHPAFAVETLRTLARSDRVHPPLEVTVPGEDPHRSFFTVVSNVAPYSYVGPRRMVLTTDAGLDRPLALTSIQRFSWRAVAGVFGSAVGSGRRIASSPHVVQRHDLATLTVRSADDRPFPWQVDGDHLGDATEVVVRHEPDALALLMPVSEPRRSTQRG